MQYVSYSFIVCMVKMKSISKLTIWSLLSVRFDYKPASYKPCDLL